MRIALINENSQAAKNAAIEAALKKVVTPMGHQVDNYGMYGKEGEGFMRWNIACPRAILAEGLERFKNFIVHKT